MTESHEDASVPENPLTHGDPSLVAPTSPDPAAVRFCAQCGSARGDGPFCSRCGTPFVVTGQVQMSDGAKGAVQTVNRIPWWKNGGVIAGVSAAVVLLLAAAAFGAVKVLSSGSHTVEGTLTLRGSSGVSYNGMSCEGTRGYDDITAGAQVTVKDGSGSVLAVGNLSPGRGNPQLTSGCAFTFTVDGVPDSPIYQVSAGRSGRGGPNYTKSDMEAQDWKVELVLGS